MHIPSLPRKGRAGRVRLRLERLEDRTMPALSAWWADAGIGSPALVGSTTVDTPGAMTIRGAGSADQMEFHYRELTGDGSLLADLPGAVIPGPQPFPNSRFGLMLRDSTAANARFASLSFTPAGWSFAFRNTTGGAVQAIASSAAGAWVKLVRDGPLVSGYVSATGGNGPWSLVGTAAPGLDDPALMGLAVTSGDSSALATATFNGVSAADPVPLGANLEAVEDWSRSNAFVDLVKQTRGFGTPSDANAHASTDANGWPLQDFAFIAQTGTLNTGHEFAGTYKLRFTGQATVDPWFSRNGSIGNVVYNAATNTTTADVSINPLDTDSVWYLALRFTNTKRTPTSPLGSGVTDVHLIRPGYDPAHPPMFTNEFLAEMQRFSTLRFMDWASTNNSTVVNWSDRTPPTGPQTTHGVSWEAMIELANTLGKDTWVNVPAQASDDYVRQLATLLHNTLRPDLAVYVEYSNEVWNFGFNQASWNLAQANTEVSAGGSPLNYDGDTNQYDWAARRVGLRTKQISDIFSSVWGAAVINTRVRPVLAAQFAWPGLWLQQPLQFLTAVFGDPSRYLYAAAGAPYFAVGSADQQTLTKDGVLNALSSAASALVSGGLYGVNEALAKSAGLRYLAYEGGPDTAGGNNVQAKKDASLDPRMQTIVQDYLNSWYTAGNGLFNWYVGGATSWDTSFGTWGLKDDMTQPDANYPKVRGVDATLAAEPPAVTIGSSVPGFVSGAADTDHASATGPSSFIGPNVSRDYLLTVPLAGLYTVTLSYSSDTNTGGPVQLKINGQTYSLTLPATNGWSAWADAPTISVMLPTGVTWLNFRNVANVGFMINGFRVGSSATRALLSVPANNVAAPGATVTLTATASGAAGVPTGTVRFLDGSTLLGTASLNVAGQATLAVSSLAPGNHLLTVAYPGANGFAASSSPAQSLVVTGTLPPASFAVKINFQPASAAVPAAYLVDSGTVFGNRGNGYSYGWNLANGTTAIDRNAANSPDQRYDTLESLQSAANPNGIWQLAVPNGTYRVRVVAGDPIASSGYASINVAGQSAIRGQLTSTTHWFDNTVTVSVAYGRLTVNNGAGASGNPIDFIEVTQLSSAVLPAGEAGAYFFGEASGSTTADSSGSANNGTLAGSVTWGSGRSAANGSDLEFDGTGSVTLAHDLSRWLGGSATVAFWLRTTQIGNDLIGQAPGILGVQTSTSSNDLYWGWLDASGRIGVQAGNLPGAKSANPINDGRWHHVALTRNAATGLTQVYVDGMLSGQATSDTGTKTTSFRTLGRIDNTNGPAEDYRGGLDDVVIYNRVLSGAQIAQLAR